MSNPYGLCVDVQPPGQAFDPRLEAGRLSSKELALSQDRLWQPGQELRIRFLDGDARVRARVQEHASAWLDFAHLRFTFGNHSSAEIRITFTGNGFSSYLGTDALQIGPERPTMRLGGLSRDSDETELRRVVLHEFGHCLGCVHEQASPGALIRWDEEKVFSHYRDWQGWDRAKTRENVLDRYSGGDLRHSDYDPDSIMHYPVPPELTRDGSAVGWNTRLSEGDRSFIALLYPPRA